MAINSAVSYHVVLFSTILQYIQSHFFPVRKAVFNLLRREPKRSNTGLEIRMEILINILGEKC